MSTRGDDRPYKVVYSSRRRDDYEEQVPSRKPRRDIAYEEDYRRQTGYSRDYRDRDGRFEIDHRSRASDSRTSLPEAIGTIKTRYAVGRDSNAESYVKRSDAVVVEDRPMVYNGLDYEVLRPQRRDDGTYVVDVGRGRSRDCVVDLDSGGYNRLQQSRYEVLPPLRRDDAMLFETFKRGGCERETSAVAYRGVQIMEDEDDRYSRRGRASESYQEDIPPPQRLRSAMRGRNDTPPDLRRRASVGFYQDQISRHDVSESRHERPGAEAQLAGRYLEGNGRFDDNTYAPGYTRRNRSRSRSGGRYGPQRSDPRLHEYDEHDEDRRTFTEETMRRYEHEDDQQPAYPPQTGYSRRRHHQHYRDDDDRYSQYDTEILKRTTKEYYR